MKITKTNRRISILLIILLVFSNVVYADIIHPTSDPSGKTIQKNPFIVGGSSNSPVVNLLVGILNYGSATQVEAYNDITFQNNNLTLHIIDNSNVVSKSTFISEGISKFTDIYAELQDFKSDYYKASIEYGKAYLLNNIEDPEVINVEVDSDIYGGLSKVSKVSKEQKTLINTTVKADEKLAEFYEESYAEGLSEGSFYADLTIVSALYPEYELSSLVDNYRAENTSTIEILNKKQLEAFLPISDAFTFYENKAILSKKYKILEETTEYVDLFILVFDELESAYYIPKTYNSVLKDSIVINYGSSFTPIILPFKDKYKQLLNTKGGLGIPLTASIENKVASNLKFNLKDLVSLDSISIPSDLKIEDTTSGSDFYESNHPTFTQKSYESRYKGITKRITNYELSRYVPIKNDALVSLDTLATTPFEDINLIPQFWSSGVWSKYFGYSNSFEPKYTNEEKLRLERTVAISLLRNGGPIVRGLVEEMEISNTVDFALEDISQSDIISLNNLGFFNKELDFDILKKYTTYEEYLQSRLVLTAYGEYLRLGDTKISSKFKENRIEFFTEVLTHLGLSKLSTPKTKVAVEDLPLDHIQYLMHIIKKSQAYEDTFYEFMRKSVSTPNSRLYKEFLSSGVSDQIEYNLNKISTGVYHVNNTNLIPSILDYAYIEQLPSDSLTGTFSLGRNQFGGRYSTHFISPYKSIIDLPDFEVRDVLSYKQEGDDLTGLYPTEEPLVISGDKNYLGINIAFNLPQGIAKSTLKNFRDLLAVQGVDLTLSVQTENGGSAIPISKKLEPDTQFIKNVLNLLDQDIKGNKLLVRELSQRIYIPINTLDLEAAWISDTDLKGDKPFVDAKYLNFAAIINTEALREGLLLTNKKADIYIPNSNNPNHISEFNFNNNYYLASLPIKKGTPDLIVSHLIPKDYKLGTKLPLTVTSDVLSYKGDDVTQVVLDSELGILVTIGSIKPFDTDLPLKLDYINKVTKNTLDTYTFTKSEKVELSTTGQIELLLPIGSRLDFTNSAQWNGDEVEIEVRVNTDQLNGIGTNIISINERGTTKTYPEAYGNNINKVIFSKSAPVIPVGGTNYIDYNELTSLLVPEGLRNIMKVGEVLPLFEKVGGAKNWDLKFSSISSSPSISNATIPQILGTFKSLPTATASDYQKTKTVYQFVGNTNTNVNIRYTNFQNMKNIQFNNLVKSEKLSDISKILDTTKSIFKSQYGTNSGLLVIGELLSPGNPLNYISGQITNSEWKGQVFGIREFSNDKPTLGSTNSTLSKTKSAYSEDFINNSTIIGNSSNIQDNILLEISGVNKIVATGDREFHPGSIKRDKDGNKLYDSNGKAKRNDSYYTYSWKNLTTTPVLATYKMVDYDVDLQQIGASGSFAENTPIEVKMYNSKPSNEFSWYKELSTNLKTTKTSKKNEVILTWNDDPNILPVNRKMYDYEFDGTKFVSKEVLVPGAYKRPTSDLSRMKFSFDDGDWLEDPTNSNNGIMGALHFNFKKTMFIPRNIASAVSYWYSNTHNPHNFAAISSGYSFEFGDAPKKKIAEITYMSKHVEGESSEIPGFVKALANDLNSSSVVVKTNMNDSDNMIMAKGSKPSYINSSFDFNDTTVPEPIIDPIGENEYRISTSNFNYTLSKIGTGKSKPLEVSVDAFGNFSYPNINNIINNYELVYSKSDLPLYEDFLDVQQDLDKDNKTSYNVADYVEEPAKLIVVEEVTYALYLDVQSDDTHYIDRRMPDYAEVYFQLYLDKLSTGAGASVSNLGLRSKPSWLIILGEISDAIN